MLVWGTLGKSWVAAMTRSHCRNFCELSVSKDFSCHPIQVILKFIDNCLNHFFIKLIFFFTEMWYSCETPHQWSSHSSTYTASSVSTSSHSLWAVPQSWSRSPRCAISAHSSSCVLSMQTGSVRLHPESPHTSISRTGMRPHRKYLSLRSDLAVFALSLRCSICFEHRRVFLSSFLCWVGSCRGLDWILWVGALECWCRNCNRSYPSSQLALWSLIANAVLAGDFSRFCYRFAFFDRLLGSLLTLYRPLLSTQTYPRLWWLHRLFSPTFCSLNSPKLSYLSTAWSVCSLRQVQKSKSQVLVYCRCYLRNDQPCRRGHYSPPPHRKSPINSTAKSPASSQSAGQASSAVSCARAPPYYLRSLGCKRTQLICCQAFITQWCDAHFRSTSSSSAPFWPYSLCLCGHRMHSSVVA